MRRFEIGILGCGVISRTYLADIKAFYPDLHVLACADVSKELAEKLAGEFEIERAYTTDELLADKDVEIVVNLTPPLFHVELNKRIIAAGKHCFSEKPFAHSLKAAKEVLDLAGKTGVMVGCAPDTFLASGLMSVRYYLDTGIIGKPFMVTANMMEFGVETWHPNPGPFYEENCGPVFDMAPYYVSAIVCLLGPVDTVAGFSTRPFDTRHLYAGKCAGEDIPVNVDTTYTAILRQKSGVIVNLNLSYDIYKTSLPMFEIYGDCGTLTYPDPNFGGGTPRVYRKEQFTDTVYRKDEEAQRRKEVFYELPELFPRLKDYSRGIGVLDLADAVDRGRPNRTGRDLILHVTEVMCGIAEAVKSGRMVKMETSCERPEPLSPGKQIDQI